MSQMKVALVTGGSRGIGRAICLRLAKAGCFVGINYSSNSEAAQETLNLCQELGGKGILLPFSVTDRGAVEAGIQELVGAGGGLHILINNAGISKDGLLMRFSDDDWDATVDTNLKGSFFCVRAATKIMMKGRYGRIVNVSSVVGQMGNAGQIAYASSKAGLLGLTKTVARELASRNITCNAVAPGFIETDMTAALPEAVKAEHFKSIPLGRYGKAEEVADLVAFLASDESAYITGQVIGINGGMYI